MIHTTWSPCHPPTSFQHPSIAKVNKTFMSLKVILPSPFSFIIIFQTCPCCFQSLSGMSLNLKITKDALFEISPPPPPPPQKNVNNPIFNKVWFKMISAISCDKLQIYKLVRMMMIKQRYSIFNNIIVCVYIFQPSFVTLLGY